MHAWQASSQPAALLTRSSRRSGPLGAGRSTAATSPAQHPSTRLPIPIRQAFREHCFKMVRLSNRLNERA